MNNIGLSRGWCAALTAAFVSFISLPFLGSLFGWDLCHYVGENRVLASCPDLSLSGVRKFPQGFEEFYKDHFGFRNALIRGQSLLTHQWLMLPSDQVVFGKSRWLYLVRNRGTDDFLGENLFDSGQLAHMRSVIEGRQAWLARRGIKYLFVVAPDKKTVYPEYLPDYMRMHKGRTRLEQVSQYMRANPGLNYLDLSETLLANRRGGRLFYYGDDHWSPTGKFVGCEAISRRLAEWFPAMRPWRLDDYRIGRQKERSDLLILLGVGWASPDVCESLEPKSPPASRAVDLALPKGFVIPLDWAGRLNTATENDKGSGKLVVFSDSFMTMKYDWTSLLPLTENFQRVAFLQMRMDYDALRLMVEQEQPDAVVEEWTQYLLDVPEDHPEWDLAREKSSDVTVASGG